MGKAKIGQKIAIRRINDIDLSEPIMLDVFYDDVFFIYLPSYLEAIIKPEDNKTRFEGTKNDRKTVRILTGDNPDQIKTKLWQYLLLYYSGSITEEKIIHYNFRFNSSKHYMNHGKHISFADTPAMSLKWGIHFLITFPDGRQTVLSEQYKSFGSVATNKSETELSKYSEKTSWIHWSEEREKFFANTELSMEALINKVNTFFTQDPKVLAAAVDSMPKLIG